MRRFVILCWLVAGSVTALILFQIKQEVRVLEEQVADTRRTILEDQEAVHVLEAEWSYLNSPARIGALAERHLDLAPRSEEHTSELKSLMRISYAVFCLKKTNIPTHTTTTQQH